MATQREIEAMGIIGAAAELLVDNKITQEQYDDLVRIAKEGRGPKLTLVSEDLDE